MSVGTYAGTNAAGSGNLIVSGNVGIGTTSPAVNLHVAGKTYSSSGFWVAGGDLINTVNGSTWYGLGAANFTLSGGGASAVQLAGWGGLNFQTSSGQMVLLGNGNVGIGTTNPQSTLDVNGDINVMTASSSIHFNSYDTYGTYMTLSRYGISLSQNGGSPQSISLFENIGANGNNGGYAFFANQHGVNIGSNNPTALLTVNGWSNASVDLLNIASSGGTSYLFVPKTGNVGIGTTSPTTPLDVSGTSGGGVLYGTAFIMAESGAANGSPTVGFKQTIYGREYHLGINGNGNQAFALGDVTAGSYPFVVEPGTPSYTLYEASTGRVGIGWSAPQATLDVNGYARLTLQSSAPATCSSTNQGAIALTHLAKMCACNGSSWIFADSTGAACSW